MKQSVKTNDLPCLFEPYAPSAASKAVSRLWFLHGFFDKWVSSSLSKAAISQPVTAIGKLVEKVPEQTSERLSAIRESLPHLEKIRGFVIRKTNGAGSVSADFVETLQELNHSLLVIALSPKGCEKIRTYVSELEPIDYPPSVRGHLPADLPFKGLPKTAQPAVYPDAVNAVARPYFSRVTSMLRPSGKRSATIASVHKVA